MGLDEVLIISTLSVVLVMSVGELGLETVCPHTLHMRHKYIHMYVSATHWSGLVWSVALVSMSVGELGLGDRVSTHCT